jgi:hypothetical protein
MPISEISPQLNESDRLRYSGLLLHMEELGDSFPETEELQNSHWITFGDPRCPPLCVDKAIFLPSVEMLFYIGSVSGNEIMSWSPKDFNQAKTLREKVFEISAVYDQQTTHMTVAQATGDPLPIEFVHFENTPDRISRPTQQLLRRLAIVPANLWERIHTYGFIFRDDNEESQSQYPGTYILLPNPVTARIFPLEREAPYILWDYESLASHMRSVLHAANKDIFYKHIYSLSPVGMFSEKRYQR